MDGANGRLSHSSWQLIMIMRHRDNHSCPTRLFATCQLLTLIYFQIYKEVSALLALTPDRALQLGQLVRAHQQSVSPSRQVNEIRFGLFIVVLSQLRQTLWLPVWLLSLDRNDGD